MTIKVKVFPKAKKERIEQAGDILKVYLNEPALAGRANKRLIELLADHFHTKKYHIHIRKGEKNREKVIDISEVN
ncbi:MAG: DUF167 domain-containing protein [Candidatus Omnitrophota bacterium]